MSKLNEKSRRIIKSTASLLLALLMMAGSCNVFFAADSKEFVPIIRFVAASDTHVSDSNDVTMQRIGKMMQIAYSEADKDRAYKKIDALLIAGDLTNDGTKTEFDRFYSAVSASLKEGTRFLGVVAKNHDGYDMSRSEMREYYQSVTGNDADFDVVINGFHFIGISASANDSFHYDAQQLSALKSHLDNAAKENPDRPVFVIHHEPNIETVYGSSVYDGWGVPFFRSILSRYPQAVDFAGHSHYPLNDPRSVWQGQFTAIGTGAIYYSEFTIDGYRVYHPDDSHDTATFWLVELDAQNNMRLRGYDVNEGKQLCELMLDNPADKANRAFTPARREAESEAPVFPKGAKADADLSFGGCTVKVPVAESADGMPVVMYRAYAKNSLGMTVAKAKTLPPYYRAVEQQEAELTFTALEAGEYTITVVAENAYGKQSEPIKLKVKIDGENIINNIPVRFSKLIDTVKDFFAHLFS